MPLLFREVSQDQRVMALAACKRYRGQVLSAEVLDGVARLLGRTDHGRPALTLAYLCGILAVTRPIISRFIGRSTQ